MTIFMKNFILDTANTKSYSELFWSLFSCIRTEYGEVFRISPYSIRMQANTDQNNSWYGHFSRSEVFDRVLNALLIHKKFPVY